MYRINLDRKKLKYISTMDLELFQFGLRVETPTIIMNIGIIART